MEVEISSQHTDGQNFNELNTTLRTGGGLNMHKLTDKKYEAYMKMLRDKEAGRLLTPDGLRMICSAHEYDPEKIGVHMLTVLANWNKIDVTE